ncbi:MAG: Eco57I restriction-modification methylase domain-containing protein [Finegoldia magna]
MESLEKINIYQELRELISTSTLESAMRSELWVKLMKLLADEFNTIGLNANNEADVATNIDSEIIQFSNNLLEPFGIDKLNLSKEFGVSLKKQEEKNGEIILRQAKGRVDSKYSSVIIEYKQPSTYKNKADTDKAFYQALQYMDSLYNNFPGTYIGIITDGTRCQFIKFDKDIKQLYDDDKTQVSPLTFVKKLNYEMVNIMFKYLINLKVKALTSDNLIKDLVKFIKDGKSLIYSLTNSLFESLKVLDSITYIDYGQWMNDFGLSHEDLSKQQTIEERRRDLAKIINREKIDTDEEYKILFSLHTSISIVAMLIAYRVVILIKGINKTSFKDLLELNMEDLRVELGKIASGSISRELKIYNLLEVGAFSWVYNKNYWTEKIYSDVKSVIEVLMKYETMPDLTSKTDDLFRELYMSIIPVSVRHSLGEYYTPDWLAEHVINNGLDHISFDTENIRILDSTAGSGTFIQKAIEKKRRIYKGKEDKVLLNILLDEVVAIDANSLAVILGRINYFLAIADLIAEDDEIFIPFYIGDSSVPATEMITDDGRYLKDVIRLGTDKYYEVKIPLNAIHNTKGFIPKIQDIPKLSDNDEMLREQLETICSNSIELNTIIDDWLELRREGYLTPSVISAITNFSLLYNIGKFDLIVGNPPWVDWKSLPSVHREDKKVICDKRNLFSGDGRTGGNSLNICALISNVSAENWLSENGVMALLMPQSLLFQQSYEGYRNFVLVNGKKLYFQEITDWSKSGYPFYPVTQKFCTYIISPNKQDYYKGIPLKIFEIKKGVKLDNIKTLINNDSMLDYFDISEFITGMTHDKRSAFSYAKDSEELINFSKIAGKNKYLGREGVELYPQEIQLLIMKDFDINAGTANLKNYQSNRSKISIPPQSIKLETKYLRPLIKGINITRFHVDSHEYVVPFPYDKDNTQVPIGKIDLNNKSPRLLEYYENNKEYLIRQTNYSDKIIGDESAPYYSLARTGPYSHAEWYVIFRDNTKWVAAVTGKIKTDWGDLKIPAFQNHCVSICESPNGEFITEDEAHYVCAILNSNIVEDFILSTSDKRTFKIRIPIKIAPYNESNEVHRKLSTLSKIGHKDFADNKKIESIRKNIDKLYIQSLDEI